MCRTGMTKTPCIAALRILIVHEVEVDLDLTVMMEPSFRGGIG